MAAGRGIGFSRFVSLGEHVDVDFADLLDLLANRARAAAGRRPPRLHGAGHGAAAAGAGTAPSWRGWYPVDVRLQVFYSRRQIGHDELARLTQPDYERELAFDATASAADGSEETLGVVRASTDPDNVEAGFGIVVRSELKGGGLGERLMHKLIGYQRQRGAQRLVATALHENTRMLELARELGFTVAADADEPDTQRIELALR